MKYYHCGDVGILFQVVVKIYDLHIISKKKNLKNLLETYLNLFTKHILTYLLNLIYLTYLLNLLFMLLTLKA